LCPRESRALGEGRGNEFIVFRKRGTEEIAVEAGNSREVRELRRKLYQKVKQEETAKATGRKMIGKSYSGKCAVEESNPAGERPVLEIPYSPR
jgi:hypothetical protein